jgi:hypothetical protein
VSAGFEDKRGTGEVIYWPAEGRFLFSFKPFKGAVEDDLFGSQVKFDLQGQTYLLLTGVPATRVDHVWMKHEPDYKPSQHHPNARDDQSFLGKGDRSDFPQE